MPIRRSSSRTYHNLRDYHLVRGTFSVFLGSGVRQRNRRSSFVEKPTRTAADWKRR